MVILLNSGGGRTATSNQGNYYQQQNMRGTEGTQQSRNTPSGQQSVGYRNGTYNNPSAEPKLQQSPVQSKQPENVSTPAPSDASVLKPESQPLSESIDETAETKEDSTAKPQFRKKRPFVKVSNKVRRARQNAKLRRILNPKNALTFLNELRPGGVKFVLKEELYGGFVASVDIDGKTFSGHGTSMSKAKVNASEQALKYLLLEQINNSQRESADTEIEPENDHKMDSSGDGEEPAAKKPKIQPEDKIPWGSLASFALHKLFSEWQKGEPGISLLPPTYPSEKYNEDIPVDFTWHPGPPLPVEVGFPRRSFTPLPLPRNRWFGVSVPSRSLLPPTHNKISPLLPGTTVSKVQPMKKIPEDATKRHPVMLLNQLKPEAVYNETKEGELPNMTFVISVEVDGQVYTGRGKNKKEARKQAAKAALSTLGIVYSDDE